MQALLRASLRFMSRSGATGGVPKFNACTRCLGLHSSTGQTKRVVLWFRWSTVLEQHRWALAVVADRFPREGSPRSMQLNHWLPFGKTCLVMQSDENLANQGGPYSDKSPQVTATPLPYLVPMPLGLHTAARVHLNWTWLRQKTALAT